MTNKKIMIPPNDSNNTKLKTFIFQEPILSTPELEQQTAMIRVKLGKKNRLYNKNVSKSRFLRRNRYSIKQDH